MQRELGYDECVEMLERHHFGRLGVRDADGIYIVPISYVLENGSLLGHAPPGHKLHLMRMWPHVALEIDEVEGIERWRSVLIKACYEEILDREEQSEVRLRLLVAAGGSLPSVTAGHGHRVSLAEATLFRLRIESISGRAESW